MVHVARRLLFLASIALFQACGGGGGDSAPSASAATNTTTLAWDAVTNAQGYRIYYGTAPGQYIQPFGQGVNAASATTFPVTGLNAGSRYYFVATAYDSLGNESNYSNEVFKDIP